MKTLLWLDDMRNPFEGDWVYMYSPIGDTDIDIHWVKSYDEFTEWITKNGMPDGICFDHDLGEDVARDKVSNGMSKRQARIQKRETKSGFDCAKWLVEYCMDKDLDLPEIGIQSANPVGADNIRGLLLNYKKHRNEN
jgi:hypothetical protein